MQRLLAVSTVCLCLLGAALSVEHLLDDDHYNPGFAEHPDVRVRVGPERFEARAETLSAPEKARVWPDLVAVFAPYAGYQRKTTRDIPVVRLVRNG